MTVDLKEHLIAYITHHLDRDLVLAVDEAIREAYAKAHTRASSDLRFTNPSRLRGQQRRYFVDDAVAGIANGKYPSVRETFPKGEHFVVLCSGNITLSHIGLHEGTKARDAKHRRVLAKRNAILEPQTFDFFKPAPPELEDSLHLVAVVIHPKPGVEDQAQPEEVLITVPFTDWSGFHLDIPLRELVQAYTTATPALSERDAAWPTLKKALRRAENSSE